MTQLPLDSQAMVLGALRRAGGRGVRYSDLRQRLGGESAQPTIDTLIGDGYRIVRCTTERGVIAVLLGKGAA